MGIQENKGISGSLGSFLTRRCFTFILDFLKVQDNHSLKTIIIQRCHRYLSLNYILLH
ncbi:hypothetical protein HanXRQr2_Chr08g0326481 [Helianthus annuus]|uniref:Uncharacterized protein n=1 Tax=Helianthus annuus TaxID=4232 RepID=A0A9K3IDM2_HELAN|nr:hypothetical protein HanXRQr2_Chr08g0326481 [Helianthus annuus]KAJ0537988.1 hypothetical protein HanHA300_Chr08g0269911 [Helianthus annuus]KAJ0552576.1 hypothetical protein HanHA89_Chr08g0286761 [Helianthus annuus]KAJ0718271.1 hypothetical protein HanLR1_Chr08g0268781 [Helianthus annuus]KAJ0721508.1 hypothetical protein HanOQP8_Chr08g0276321 [Helianthus annuus]